MRIRSLTAFFFAVSSLFACEHDCSYDEIQRDVGGRMVWQSARGATDAPRDGGEVVDPGISSDTLSGNEGTSRGAMWVSDGTRTLATMRDPKTTGTFALSDLGAETCDVTVDGGVACTPLTGTLQIDVYEASCTPDDDPCTYFSARVYIEPPPILGDGPMVFGEATTTERRVKHAESCSSGCCSGGSGWGPGQL